MKSIFTLLVLSIALVACKKPTPANGEILYPEYHQGKINLLALTEDTFYVDAEVEFVLAANVHANRSIRIVCKPESGTFWGGFGLNAFPSNPHLEWDNTVERMIYSSLAEELEEYKTCAVDGITGPSNPGEAPVNIHVIIYEDQTEWMTRYITIVPN